MNILSQMSPTLPPIKLNTVEDFKSYFELLSNSVAAANPHEQLADNSQTSEFASVHE